MNIMSITNTSFSGKPIRPRVNWARNINNSEYPVEISLRDKVRAITPELEQIAKKEKKNITLAQRDNSLLVNSGAITTLIKDIKTKCADDIYREIENNIIANKRASRGEALSNILG